MWLIVKTKKKQLIIKKICFFFRKRSCLLTRNCAKIFHATNIYYTVYHFDIMSLRFRKWKAAQYFQNTFYHRDIIFPCSYTKPRLSQGLPPDMELFFKMFPTIFNMKNASRVQKKIFFKIVRKRE